MPGTHRSSHYAVLDGLRGLAALMVVALHVGTWLDLPWLAPHSGLAVDFFFCLSGYVLSLAYHAKLNGRLSVPDFARARLIRLMPIIVVATAMSAAYTLARHLLTHDAIPMGRLALLTVLGALCLPWLGSSAGIEGTTVFPLNFPQYTLFLELVVNVVWARLRRVDALLPSGLVAVAGYLACARWGLGGVDVDDFWTGFPRVFGGFYAGVFVYHAKARWPALSDEGWRRAFPPVALATLVLFLAPLPVPFAIEWLWCAFVSPLLVLSGTKVALGGVLRRVALGLGALSYPVYALQWPFMVWTNGLYQQMLGRKDVGTALLSFTVVVLGSWLVLHLVDTPVRGMLTGTRRGK